MAGINDTDSEQPANPSSTLHFQSLTPQAMQAFPFDFKKPNVVLFMGETESGKTMAIRFVVFLNQQYFDQIVIYSETSQYEDELQFTRYQMEEYSPSSLEMIGNIQKERRKKHHGDVAKIPHILIIFDDADRDYNRDVIVNRLITKHRHFRMSFIFSVQYYAMVSPRMRAQTRWLCLRPIRGKANIEAVWEYLSLFFEAGVREFIIFIRTCLRDWTLAVFDIRSEQRLDQDVYMIQFNPELVAAPFSIEDKPASAYEQAQKESDE